MELLRGITQYCNGWNESARKAHARTESKIKKIIDKYEEICENTYEEEVIDVLKMTIADLKEV